LSDPERDDLGDDLRSGAGELFLPGLIHELRHPLLAIKAGLQLLAQKLEGPLREGEDLTLVTGQVARLEEILRNWQELLDPAGMAVSDFPAGEAARRAAALLAFRLRPLGGRFSVEDRDALSARGSPNAVVHALVNLLGNALDAMEPTGGSGRLALRILAGAGKVELRVSDEGPGVPPELRERIFEPRFTTKPRGKGSGLGLPLSRKLLRASGGELRLADAGDPQRLPWAGAEMVIELPAAR
jgi:signal transduction histidine kinase